MIFFGMASLVRAPQIAPAQAHQAPANIRDAGIPQRTRGKANSGQQWTVPLGGGVGRIFHFGKLPVNTQISALLQRGEAGPRTDWQIRARVQLEKYIAQGY